MNGIDAVGKNFSNSPSKKKELKLKKDKTNFLEQLDDTINTQEKEAVREPGGTSFNFQKKAHEDKNLEALLDNVHTQGERLKECPTLASIREYKSSIKNFLTYVVDHMLKVEEKSSGFNILKRKRYTLIKVIDKKLEDLTLEVLRGQTEQLGILRKVEEINGLVVDLLRNRI
jgi:uncharacterized protein YaaR (DUF327 family)